MAVNIDVDFCILGGGPTALLLASVLKKEKTRFLLITEKLEGALVRLNVNGRIFNPIPIFPAINSYLYTKLNLDEIFPHNEQLRFEYANLLDVDILKLCLPDSAGATLYRTQGAQSLALSRKQFGEIVMKKPLQRLQDKVARHYSPNGQSFSRLGFANGISAYLTYINQQSPFPVIDGKITSVDVNAQKVFIEKIEIRYKYLISTIPLPEFFTYANIEDELSFVSTSAQFYVFQTEAHLSANQIIYDCDINSCVYRVFIPHEHFLSVQVAHDCQNQNPSKILDRVQELLHNNNLFRYIQTINLKNCYPLDVIPLAKHEKIRSLLEQKGVYLFGRISQWEYLDLHELDWKLIDQLIMRIDKPAAI